MKKLILASVFAFLLAGSNAFAAPDYPEEYIGLPGDNLNLYAVMDLFRESATLEGFEKSLNNPEKVINNLDLNSDNYVDYIMVKDYIDGSVHTIVMSVALNATESQDVAVFTVEKFSDGSVQIQLIGDEALYGKNYIIEPIYEETPNPGYKGNDNQPETVKVVTTTYYEVAAWPAVRYIFVPTYAVYYSPWYWGYYPATWVHWNPYYWHYYYGYHYNWHSHYYGYYRPWHHYRYHRYNDFYYNGFRHRSTRVEGSIRDGNYRSTYTHPDEMSKGINHYERDRDQKKAANPGAEATNGSSDNQRKESPATRSDKSAPETRTNPNNIPTAPAVKSRETHTRPAPGSSESRSGNDRGQVKPEKPTAPPSKTRSESPSGDSKQKSVDKREAPRERDAPSKAKSADKPSDRASTKSSERSGAKSSERSSASPQSHSSKSKASTPSRSSSSGSKSTHKSGSSRESSSKRN